MPESDRILAMPVLHRALCVCVVHCAVPHTNTHTQPPERGFCQSALFFAVAQATVCGTCVVYPSFLGVWTVRLIALGVCVWSARPPPCSKAFAGVEGVLFWKQLRKN